MAGDRAADRSVAVLQRPRRVGGLSKVVVAAGSIVGTVRGTVGDPRAGAFGCIEGGCPSVLAVADLDDVP